MAPVVCAETAALVNSHAHTSANTCTRCARRPPDFFGTPANTPGAPLLERVEERRAGFTRRAAREATSIRRTFYVVATRRKELFATSAKKIKKKEHPGGEARVSDTTFPPGSEATANAYVSRSIRQVQIVGAREEKQTCAGRLRQPPRTAKKTVLAALHAAGGVVERQGTNLNGGVDPG